MSTDSVYFRKSIRSFKKHRSFVWIYSQLQIHTMLYVGQRIDVKNEGGLALDTGPSSLYWQIEPGVFLAYVKVCEFSASAESLFKFIQKRRSIRGHGIPGGSLSHISATHPCAHTSKSAPKWRNAHHQILHP